MIKLEFQELKNPIKYVQKNRSDGIKKAIRHRDKCCQKCGCSKGLEVHHILPLCYGGIENLYNCILLCHKCHKFAPNEPFLFMKYIKKYGTITFHNAPLCLRLYTSHLKKSNFCEFIEDSKKYVENYIKANVIPKNYKELFWYRNSKNIWEKENLNDLFNLSDITDFVFGDRYEYTPEEIISNKEKKRLHFFSMNRENRKKRILKIIENNPNISYCAIGRKLNVTHRTVQNYLK